MPEGTSIASMREWMKKAGLGAPSIFEAGRDKNEFLVLLPHHPLDHKNLEWLSQLRVKLSDAELRALVVARERRAITNEDYRQINRTDTLTASRALVDLRDFQGLLSMKGAGNGTYYVLVPRETPFESGAPHTTGLPGEVTPHINPLIRRTRENSALKG